MSKRIVSQLAANFARTHHLYLQFVDQCPDELWVKRFGPWPLWQHIVHVYGSIDHLVLQEGQEPTPYPCRADNILAFAFDADAMMDKTAMRVYMQIMKAKADAYIDGLTDAALGETHAGYSSRKIHSMNAAAPGGTPAGHSAPPKEDCSHALALSMLAAHPFYHFGILDTALRDHGCKGIY